MFWSFAFVNGKLAELFFERKRGKITFLGHAYVKKAGYKTKEEQSYIRDDTEKTKLIYRNGKYKRVLP